MNISELIELRKISKEEAMIILRQILTTKLLEPPLIDAIDEIVAEDIRNGNLKQKILGL